MKHKAVVSAVSLALALSAAVPALADERQEGAPSMPARELNFGARVKAFFGIGRAPGTPVRPRYEDMDGRMNERVNEQRSATGTMMHRDRDDGRPEKRMMKDSIGGTVTAVTSSGFSFSTHALMPSPGQMKDMMKERMKERNGTSTPPAAPPAVTVTVNTGASTVYTKDGTAATAADLTVGAMVMVHGSFSTTTKTMTALEVGIFSSPPAPAARGYEASRGRNEHGFFTSMFARMRNFFGGNKPSSSPVSAPRQ